MGTFVKINSSTEKEDGNRRGTFVELSSGKEVDRNPNPPGGSPVTVKKVSAKKKAVKSVAAKKEPVTVPARVQTKAEKAQKPVQKTTKPAAPKTDPSAYGYDPMVAQDLENRQKQTAALKPGAKPFSAGKLAADTVMRGVNEFAGFFGSGFAMAEDLIGYGEGLLTGQPGVNLMEGGPLNTWNQSIQREGQAMERSAARNIAKGGKAAETVYKYGTQTVAAVPQAVLAMLTGGGSAAASTASLAGTAAKALSPSLSRTVSQAVSGMAKNPQYWTSFAQVVGPGYQQALADGADHAHAALYAVGNGLLNAAEEIGGGIQSLPAALKGGAQTWKAVVDSMLEEGREEVVQGIIERAMQNIVYNQGNQLASVKDDRAVFNPRTALEEFKGGAVVGGILGGGQAAVQAGVNAHAQAQVQKTLELMQKVAADRNAEIQSIQKQAEQEAADWVESLDLPRPVDISAVNSQADQSASAIVRSMFSEKPQSAPQQTQTPPVSSDTPVRQDAVQTPQSPARAAPESVLRMMQNIQQEQQARPGSILLNGDQLAQINQEIAKQQTPAPVDIDHMLKGRTRLDYEQLPPDSQAAVDSAYKRGAVGMDAAGKIFRVVPENHIDQREITEVGPRRSLNAFQFDHPELHRFFSDAAEWMKGDLANTIKGGEIHSAPGVLSDGVTPSMYDRYWRTSRQTSEPIALLLDSGMSYARIEKALEAIINDMGQENYADAKRVEMVLDGMLSDGYKDATGRPIPGIPEYVEAKSKIAGSLDVEQDGTDMDAAPVNDGLGAADAGFDPLSALENQYDVLPEGEKAVRSDDIPRQTTDTDKVSLLARTIKGAGVVPDSFIPVLERAVLDGKFSYIPHTNAETAAKARQTIEYKGWQRAFADFHSDVERGRASDAITAMGVELFNNAVNAGDISAALDLSIDLQKTVRNAGQAAQAVRILKQSEPAHRLYMIQRSVQSMVDAMNLPEGSVKLDETLLKNYLDAPTEEQRDAVISEIQQNVADQLPSSLLDQWNALRYVNMLGNFRTQVRNVAGNVGMQAVRAVKDKIALALEAVCHQINPNLERTKALTTSSELKAAARADYANVADAALGEGKYQEGLSDDAFQRGVDDKRTIFKNNGTWGTEQGRNAFLRSAPVRFTRQAVGGAKAAMEGYRRVTNWGMTQGDVLFTRYTYTRALAGYLKTHGVTAEQFSSPEWKSENSAFVDKARMYAIQEAQEATFRDNNALSNWVSRLGRKSSTPRGVRIASEGLAPFRKTPANVLVRAEEYSLLGFINTIYEAVQAHHGNASGADVINSLSKALTGTGLLAAGWALAAGLIPGLRLRASDDDDDRQKQFDNMTGRQSYSVEGDAWTLDVFGRSLEVPDWSYTLDWLTPGSMPLFMGAEFARLAEEDGLTLSDLEQALTSIAEPMVQMSMLQGVNDTLNDLKYSNDNLGQLAVTLGVSYLTQGLTNTLLGQMERTFEDTRQMTYTDKNSPVPSWLQRQTGKASAKTPGWDYRQTDYINPWGQTESSGTIPARAAENFLSPGYFSTRNSGEVESELQRLADATGETSVFPAYFDRSFEVDGVTKHLTADEYLNYAKTVGKTQYDILSSLIQHPGYKKLSDADKAETISAVYGYATEVGKMQVSDYKPDSETTIELMNSPLDPATFFLYKRMMSIEDEKKQPSAQANENVRNALKNDSSLTPKEKNLLDDWIISDVTIIPQDKDVDYSSDESFAVSQMSDSAQRHWEYVRDKTGISSQDYQTAWSICSRSEKGYHKEDRIRDLMDQLGLSRPEANRLWNAVKADIDD